MSGRGEKIRVFLAGEGSNELGSRVGHPAYQSDERPGVLHNLLTRAQTSGWEVGGARDWKSIRKLRVRGASHEDTHNVVGIALDAKEAGCEVLAFSRDLDRDIARRDAIKEGLQRIPFILTTGAPEVIGGVAVPTLEGWILALLGERATEELTPKQAEAALASRGVAAKDGPAMARVAEDADLGRIPADAISLTEWLDRAREVLPRVVAERLGGVATP